MWTLIFEWQLVKNEISSQHDKFWQFAKKIILKFSSFSF